MVYLTAKYKHAQRTGQASGIRGLQCRDTLARSEILENALTGLDDLFWVVHRH